MPLNKDDFTSKMYKEYAGQEPSLSPIAIASSITAASISSTQNQKRTYDPVEQVLRPLRKAAEFKNLISELSPRSQGIPLYANPYLVSNRLYNTVSNRAYSQPFCFNDDEFEIAGYVGFTCGSCLTNDPLTISSRKQSELDQQVQLQQLQIIRTEHQCDPQKLITCSSIPNKAKDKIILDLQRELQGSIIKAVNNWTKSTACLISFEVPYNLQKGYSIDLFPDHENH